MSKNDLIDDIDYSSLHPAETTPAPTKARIEDRQFKKEKPKAEAKPIDMEALKGQAAQAKESAGMPELSPSSLDYVIPGLGILGGLYMLHQNLKSRELPSIPKQDMRAVAPVAPAAPVQAPLPAGLSPQEFDALSPEDKALVVRGGQNSIAKQTAQQELAQQVSKLQTELASIPQAANPVPVPQQQAPMAQAPAPVVQPPVNAPVLTQAPEIQVALNPTPDGSVEVEKPQEVVQKQEPQKTSKKKTQIATFKSEADIPKGYEFRADVGNLDRSIYNILGPEGRQYAKEVLNEGKMFGEYKGADYNQKVKEIISNYGEKLKEITPSIDLTTREGRIAVGAPHTTNYAAKGFGKPAKVAGIAGTLFAAADVVNAKTAEEKAIAKNNLLGAVLPPGTDILEAGAPTLGEKQRKAFENAQKLGSPYRSVPPR